MLDSRRPTANPVRLDQFEGVLQAESEWCWAAATASIFNYYASRSSGTRATVARQCRFVPYLEPGVAHPCLRYDKDEPLRECRASGCANPFANMPEDLQFELSRYGLLECEKIPFDGVARACGGRVVQGGFDLEEIWDMIGANRPVALRVNVSASTAKRASHYLVVIGYYPLPDDRLIIWDPQLGARVMTHQQIVAGYGPIQHKFLTCQAHGAAALREPPPLSGS